MNLGLALLFGGAALLVLAPAGGAPLGARLAQALRYPSVLGLLLYLTVANALLVAFNLLPAFPMDGGRLVRAVLAMRLPYMQATQGAAAMGQVVAAGFIVISLFGLSLPEIGLASNLGLALIGVVVFAGAVSEGRQMRTHAALQELTVGDAARPALKTVTPAKVVTADMAEALFAAQAVTPVVVGRQSRLVGVLVRDDPLPEGVPVAAVMRTAYPVIRRQAPLSDAVEALDRSASDEVLVTDRGNLYGVVGWPEIVRATAAPPRGRRLAAMLRSVGAGQ
ncbi:MAG: hypothetical protein M5R40_05955 [Anaerolineae bacterium]|nr:hypothetical protein [Anaerolineae bacterium]